MKITFLGIGSVGYPFAFCNCENCKNAKRHKGKSIRKKASLLINDELIIDLGSDTQTSINMYDKDLENVKYLLQTHPHYDHFDPNLLTSRISYVTNKKQHMLEIIAHPKCLDVMNRKINQEEKVNQLNREGQEKLKVNINSILPGEELIIGNYKVKAIESNHDKEEGSILYVIKYDNKSIFYATDTNELSDESINCLSTEKLDIVIMDHNFGKVNYSSSHLNEKLFLEQLNKLKELNVIDKNTKIYGTHISHEGNSYHELAEERAITNGYHIAYDGLELVI